MTTFVALLLPETKGVPLEEVSRIWEQHPIWGRVVGKDPKNPAACPKEDCPKSIESIEVSMQPFPAVNSAASGSSIPCGAEWLGRI